MPVDTETWYTAHRRKDRGSEVHPFYATTPEGPAAHVSHISDDHGRLMYVRVTPADDLPAPVPVPSSEYRNSDTLTTPNLRDALTYARTVLRAGHAKYGGNVPTAPA